MAFEDGVERTDLYALLGVARGASEREIWSGYRREVQRWHPDRNPHPEATPRTQAVNNAHEVLKDPTARAIYDRSPTETRPPAKDHRRWTERRGRWEAEYAAWEEADRVRQEKQDRF